MLSKTVAQISFDQPELVSLGRVETRGKVGGVDGMIRRCHIPQTLDTRIAMEALDIS